ncbi:MAG: VIT1/CCC1 transporter family protein [Acidimicrobiia bacterium]
MAGELTGRRARHRHEPHREPVAARMNWLRAGVLGANDGIVSTAGLVVGVAAGSDDRAVVGAAGVAGLLAGAVSMALGEYVSVSAQRDSERALVARERRELERMPDTELHELEGLLEDRGLRPETATTVARELTDHDALAAHLQLELGLERGGLARPWSAAASSAVSFVAGAVLPLVAILVPAPAWRIRVTFVAVLVALALTATVSARIGRARAGPAVVRLVAGGAAAMAATYVAGRLVDAALF